MLVASGVLSRPRQLSHPASLLLLSAAFALAACDSGAPTSPGPSDYGAAAPTPFAIAPGAAQAAAAITHQKNTVMPTIPIYEARAAKIGEASQQTNSPWDMTFLGGPVVTSAASHNVYVNCKTTPTQCWGAASLSPGSFLFDLNLSSLLAVANQYLNEDAVGKFTVNELSTNFHFGKDTAATLNDIGQILVSAVQKTGQFGYHHIYHIFFPKGQDVCIDANTCYSPDNNATFVFCAFHGSADLAKGVHVLYSVEPFQAVAACSLPQETRTIDATATALGHEFFETITDPDGDAWFNLLTQNEIGDLCFAFRLPQQIGHHAYVIQEEYSNAQHECVTGEF